MSTLLGGEGSLSYDRLGKLPMEPVDTVDPEAHNTADDLEHIHMPAREDDSPLSADRDIPEDVEQCTPLAVC